MIRSVLNSLNGGGGGLAANANEQQLRPDELPAAKLAADGGSDLHNRNGKGAGMRMISVRRGRKKLSSMMSRFRSLGGAGGEHSDHEDEEEEGAEVAGRGQLEGEAGGERNNEQAENYDDDQEDDDDDDAYKSAEEACRKMSLGGEPLQAAAPRRNSKAAKGRKGSTAAATAAYEQLKGDKKYVLPEEQCDIPTFLQTKNCDPYLVAETRRLLRERYARNPENFYEADYLRMLNDDWTVSRFLLRRRLDPKRTAKLMEECGRFRKQYKMSEVQLWEFPMEFHKAGGLFKYAPDRVGNVTMYMRVKMYRRVPEISDVFKAFILCVLEQCDVANGGRGTAVVFDLSGCGLQNVDLGFLSWLLSSFRNYCPKGVSYILVYNLPWILNATCKLAMTWMSASNKRALRFVYGDEIENFIERAHLPDYLGGECKLNYRAIPDGSKPAIEVCDRLDMTRDQAIKIRELFSEYLGDDNHDDHDADRRADDQNNNIQTKNGNKAEAPVAELVSQASKFVGH